MAKQAQHPQNQTAYSRFGLVFLFLMVGAIIVNAQNYAWRKTIDTLCSPAMNGRGYTNDGATKAANYLKAELIDMGLLPIKVKYEMQVTELINTFDSTVILTIGKNKLDVGVHFLPDPACGRFEGSFKVFNPAPDQLENKRYVAKWKARLQTGKYWLLVDTLGKETKTKILQTFAQNSAGIITVARKLTHSFDQEQGKPEVIVLPSVLKNRSKKWHFKVQPNLKAQTIQNVFASTKPITDTSKVILITAHYDHLGSIGTTYFPGANDNASGTAMTLAIAKHFTSKSLIKLPPYPVVFVFFGGEEAGLLGSKAFSASDIIPLANIKTLINLDLMAGGSEGIMMVNGDAEKELYNKLVRINNTTKTVPAIKSRPNAPNSDHYWFAKKGVPAVFLYTMGGPTAYHDIYDSPDRLPFTWFEKLYSLLIGFVVE